MREWYRSVGEEACNFCACTERMTARMRAKWLCKDCSAEYYAVMVELYIQKALDRYDALFLKLEIDEDGICGICEEKCLPIGHKSGLFICNVLDLKTWSIICYLLVEYSIEGYPGEYTSRANGPFVECGLASSERSTEIRGQGAIKPHRKATLFHGRGSNTSIASFNIQVSNTTIDLEFQAIL